MKLLLVLGSDDTYNHISLYVKPLGFELIRYYQVLKAMDNIDEVDPSAIIISARDYPRHWKAFVQFIRSERSKDACPIILLKGDYFPLEETTQAFYLGVSGIVLEDMENTSEIDRLQGILSRYMPVDDKRHSRRFHAENWQNFNFVFTSPHEHRIITGEVKTISSGGLSFMPDNPTVMKEISLDDTIPECSLRAGEDILNPVCRLARTGRIVSLQFLSFQNDQQKILDNYLETLPLRELKVRNEASAEIPEIQAEGVVA